MSTDAAGGGPVTLAFVGYTTPERAEAAHAYEDEVLALLADHGAAVVQRARRRPGQDPALPVEVHVLRFPSRAALEAYLANPRRLAALDRHGETFTDKQVVEVDLS